MKRENKLCRIYRINLKALVALEKSLDDRYRVLIFWNLLATKIAWTSFKIYFVKYTRHGSNKNRWRARTLRNVPTLNIDVVIPPNDISNHVVLIWGFTSRLCSFKSDVIKPNRYSVVRSGHLTGNRVYEPCTDAIDYADQSTSAFDRCQPRGASVIQFDRVGRELFNGHKLCANLWLMFSLFLLLSPCQPINNIIFIFEGPIEPGCVAEIGRITIVNWIGRCTQNV